jgi:hypothetical protein
MIKKLICKLENVDLLLDYSSKDCAFSPDPIAASRLKSCMAFCFAFMDNNVGKCRVF